MFTKIFKKYLQIKAGIILRLNVTQHRNINKLICKQGDSESIWNTCGERILDNILRKQLNAK